MSGVVF